MMQVLGKAKKVTVYIGESDKWKRKPLYLAILDMLKAEDCAGGTVSRALAGFGAHSRIHTANLVALSADLPLTVVWIDNPARVRRVMPKLREMVSEGLITVEDVDVAFYSHRNLRKIPASLHVFDIMSREVNAIQAKAPLLEAVEMLLDKIYRTLPVINSEGQVVGILTEGDLLRKLNMLATSAQQQLTRAEISSVLTRLQRIDQPVSSMMTTNPLTISGNTPVAQALALMVEHEIKRLPVVDSKDKLVGIVSRVDVLRTMASPLVGANSRENLLPGHQYTLVQDIMLTQVATVQATAPLAETVGLLVSNAQRRVIVVDEQQRAVGLITDGDLIERAQPAERSGIIQFLSRPLGTPPAEISELNQRRASEVMSTPIISVTPGTSLAKAIQLLLEHRIKRLPVLDDDGKLVGLVGRGGILQALAQTVNLNVPS